MGLGLGFEASPVPLLGFSSGRAGSRHIFVFLFLVWFWGFGVWFGSSYFLTYASTGQQKNAAAGVALVKLKEVGLAPVPTQISQISQQRLAPPQLD